MAALWYYFSVRDNSANGLGVSVTGLTPAWTLFKRLEDNTDIAPQPTIVEVGQGIYKYSYDAEVLGDAAGQVDALAGNTTGITLNPADRYLDQFPTRESSRLLTAINTSGQVVLSPAGLDAVQVETGVNARQALSPILASSAGLVLGAGTGTITIKGGNVATTRITATTDNAGNRTAVTLALPPASAGGGSGGSGGGSGAPVSASYYFPQAYFPEIYFPIGKVIASAGN